MARRSGTCRELPRAARSAIEELLESAKVEGERLAAVAPEACYADAHGKLTAYWHL